MAKPLLKDVVRYPNGYLDLVIRVKENGLRVNFMDQGLEPFIFILIGFTQPFELASTLEVDATLHDVLGNLSSLQRY